MMQWSGNRPAARSWSFGGQNTFPGKQDIWFYSTFKTNISGHKKIGRHCWRILPLATGLVGRRRSCRVGRWCQI